MNFNEFSFLLKKRSPKEKLIRNKLNKDKQSLLKINLLKCVQFFI
jgi:hypothetical protein